MTPNELAAKGRSLYGERWQTPLALDLHVADRTMRRWLAGHSPIPDSVEGELRNVLIQRLRDVGELIRFSINPSQHLIVHHPTNAFFQYDDAGNLTLLNAKMVEIVAPDQIPLITAGAEEALRRQRERDPELGHTWLDQFGRSVAAS